MKYTFCALTDPGRARDNNEDAVAFDEGTQLVVLADGMGGYNAGEVASSMATSLIKSELGQWLSQADANTDAAQIRRAIDQYVDHANRAIFSAANTHEHYAGMGTTLVVGVFHGARLYLGHIGDSRCYRLRGQEFIQLTRDHSWLQEHVDAGLLTAEQAAVSPHRNLVTRAMGVEADVMLELHEHAVESGDLYLLCSDGLSDMVRDPELADLVRRKCPLDETALQLVAQANQQGGRDNITVLLAQVTENPQKRGLIARWLGK
jgi:PPM family protein phosphatase